MHQERSGNKEELLAAMTPGWSDSWEFPELGDAVRALVNAAPDLFMRVTVDVQGAVPHMRKGEIAQVIIDLKVEGAPGAG